MRVEGPEPDPHLWPMDPDPDPGGPKICGPCQCCRSFLTPGSGIVPGAWIPNLYFLRA
jgi:hypothetical protein